MKLVVGLGNPGPKYETTRHNLGFLAIDRLADEWSAQGPQSQHQGEIFTAAVAGEKVLLIKPQTFMNVSGRCVGPIFQFYKCTPSDVIVIHDELDLPAMTMRLKVGGGAGGHNGLKSLDESLGTNGYLRVRLGVGHPAALGLRISPADYVLQPMGDEELTRLDALLSDVVPAVEGMIRGELSKMMNKYNTRGERE